MGACSSCLGRDQSRDLSDEASCMRQFTSDESELTRAWDYDEQSRLLFDDPHGNHYGSFGEQNAGIVQADPQEVQRETEALQKVVTLTSK